MTFTPRISKVLLTGHITFSVGWLGAVAVFLALAITGLTTTNNQLANATYLAMELSTWYIIVPFCLASFLTGIIQALGTSWGLFKHYWIVVKLFVTFAMTVLLILHLQPISYLAGVVTDSSLSGAKESAVLIDLITKSGMAIFVLIVITTISIYKPWGKIKYRKQSDDQQIIMEKKKKSTSFYLLIGLVILIAAFITMHFLGGGMGNH